eukprot:361008-Chlamydomonas_euryale.AAC.2
MRECISCSMPPLAAAEHTSFSTNRPPNASCPRTLPSPAWVHSPAARGMQQRGAAARHMYMRQACWCQPAPSAPTHVM